MSIIKNYRLRLDAGNITPLIIHVNQYDKNEIWNFTLIDYQGNQYITTEAAIVGKKPDGCLIVNNCTVAEGIVSVEVTEQMTAAAGKAVFELLVDGQMHGTANFVVLIERSPEDGAIESESDLSLFQQAIDATSTPAIIAGVQAWMDENLTPTTPVVDSSLSITGAAADAKKTGDEISELKSEIALNSGIPRAVKIALDNILQNVAFKNDTDYSADKSAIHAWATEIKALSISAVYAGTKPIYSFYDIESLRDDLVVTATYDNGTTAEVTTYTLSGALTEGTSTITVSYEGLTTTFNVTVTGKEFTYTASDGVLTEQPYFDYTQDERMTVNATSDSTNGTHIVVPKVSGSFWAKCLQSAFDFTESAHLTAEFKIINTGYYASGNTTSPGVLMFYASDGEKGSMVGFARDNSVSGDMKIRTSIGATVTKGATVSLNAWHTLDIVIANGKQTVMLDNTAVITNADLTTGKSGYSANTCIGFSTNQTADTDFYIRNVQYSAV